MRVSGRNKNQLLVPIDLVTSGGTTGGIKAGLDWTFIPRRVIVDFAPGPWALPFPSLSGHLQYEQAGLSSATSFQFSTLASLKATVSATTPIGLVLSTATANSNFGAYPLSSNPTTPAGLGGPFYYGGALNTLSADKFGSFDGIYAGCIGFQFNGGDYGMSGAGTNAAWSAIASAFTVAFWFYNHVSSQGVTWFFKSGSAFTAGVGGTFGKPHLALRTGNTPYLNCIELINTTGGVSSSLFYPQFAGGVTGVNTGSWHHVAATWALTSGTRRIYYDGVSVTSGPLSAVLGLNLSAGGLFIGKDSTQNGAVANIDDVVLFNRELAASEIASLTTQPVSAQSFTADNFLQFYYSFNTNTWTLTGHASGSATPIFTASGAAGFDAFPDYVYGVPSTWMWATASPTGFFQSPVSGASGGAGFFEFVNVVTGAPTTWMFTTSSPTAYFQSSISATFGGAGFFEIAATGLSGSPFSPF